MGFNKSFEYLEFKFFSSGGNVLHDLSPTNLIASMPRQVVFTLPSTLLFVILLCLDCSDLMKELSQFERLWGVKRVNNFLARENVPIARESCQQLMCETALKPF